MANFAVITGVSRGLGASLAKLLLETGVNVIGISRTENEELQEVAEESNQIYKHFSCDLSDVDKLEKIIDDIHEELKMYHAEQEMETIYLLNNAGVIHPIHQAQHIQSEELMRHVTINSVTPMVLTNGFLKRQEEHQIPLIVANVTSGAAERPIYGWSAYCSSKASLNMYTKTVALEQDELGTGNKIIAFSPGVMDTEMQTEIRSSTKEQFADVEKFKDYKLNNSFLIDIIMDEDVKNGKIYYVTNYL